MKRVLSVALAIIMLLTTSVTTFADIASTTTHVPNPLHLDLEIDTVACIRGTNAYASPLNVNFSGTSDVALIDYKSTLNMEPIRTLFDKRYVELVVPSLSELESEFNAGIITSDIDVTITYPSTVTLAGDKNVIGGLVGDGNNVVYAETGRTIDTNSVTIHYKNKDNLTVAELEANKTPYLNDVTFALNDVTSYQTTGTHTVTVTLSGSTTVEFASKTQTVSYSGTKPHDVIITRTPDGGGGGGVTSYTLTYVSNGGTQYASETYNSGTRVEINKVPVKNGFEFDGWYSDKELTQKVTSVEMIKNITVYAGWREIRSDVPGMLNGEDHFAYIIGYPDGNVRPNDNITRAEVATIFFRLLKDEVREANISVENDYVDVNKGDWHNKAISTLTKLGIVKGKLDSRFAPDDYITRAEFAAIAARFDDSLYTVKDNFSDIALHWAEEEIHESAAHGWVRGYEDNTFKPDQNITRAEAMTLINRVLNRLPETTDDLHEDMVRWPDNSDENEWYYLAVQEATNSHDYNVKNVVHEKWTNITENRDWAAYETK